MSIFYIYKFPIERIYNNLVSRLFVTFIVLSILSVIGFMILGDSAALSIAITYIVGIIIIGLVIHSVEIKLNMHLEERYVKTKAIDRLSVPPSIFSNLYFITHQIVCPFCIHHMAIDRTNMTNIPIFKENDTICIHYRELTPSYGRISYAKFVNLGKINQ